MLKIYQVQVAFFARHNIMCKEFHCNTYGYDCNYNLYLMQRFIHLKSTNIQMEEPDVYFRYISASIHIYIANAYLFLPHGSFHSNPFTVKVNVLPPTQVPFDDFLLLIFLTLFSEGMSNFFGCILIWFYTQFLHVSKYLQKDSSQ